MAKQNAKNTATAAKGSIAAQESDTLIDLADVAHQAEDTLTKYRLYIFGFLALVIGVAAYFAYQTFYKAPNQKKALTAVFKAEEAFAQDSFAKAVSSAGAVVGFKDIAKKYGSTETGNLAHYYSAVSYMNLGKFDEAIKEMEAFSPKGDVLPTMKNGILGDCYSEKKDYKKAISFYQSAGNSGVVEDLQAYYLKKAGMLAEMQKDNATALEAYKKIKTNFSLTPDGRDIDKFIIRAEAAKK